MQDNLKLKYRPILYQGLNEDDYEKCMEFVVVRFCHEAKNSFYKKNKKKKHSVD